MSEREPGSDGAKDAALDRLLSVDDGEPPRPGFDTRFFARLEEQKRQGPFKSQPRCFLNSCCWRCNRSSDGEILPGSRTEWLY